MATVKTAVSLDADLFREAEGLARRLKLSRSRLFAEAMREFIERRLNRRLLQAIDGACGDATDPAETRLRRSLRRQHRRRLQGQW